MSTSFGPLLCAYFPRSPSLTPSPLLSSTPYPSREQWLMAVVGWLVGRGGCHGVTVLVMSLPEDASTHIDTFSFIPGKYVTTSCTYKGRPSRRLSPGPLWPLSSKYYILHDHSPTWWWVGCGSW